MRTLKKIDIEAMERELSILQNEEQSSTIGGVYTTSCEKSREEMDCALHAIAYLTGGQYSVDDIRNDYVNSYADAYYDAGGGSRDHYKTTAENNLAAGGAGVNGAWTNAMYDKYVSSDYTYMNTNNGYNLDAENFITNALDTPPEGSGNETGHRGLVASVTVSGSDNGSGSSGSSVSHHSVVITDYDAGSKTFNYYDPQNNCSGTFEWEDLDSVVGR